MILYSPLTEFTTGLFLVFSSRGRSSLPLGPRQTPLYSPACQRADRPGGEVFGDACFSLGSITVYRLPAGRPALPPGGGVLLLRNRVWATVETVGAH